MSRLEAEESAAFASPAYLALYVQPKTPYTHVCGCARLDCTAYNKPAFLTWHRDRPLAVQCTVCNTWYPNDEFPEDKYLEVDGTRYEYHEDANGVQHHFSGRARYHRLIRALYDARYAARDYAETGAVERGRQARDVLLAVARVYPRFFYARTPTTRAGSSPVFPHSPGDWGAGRLKQYFGDYGMPSFFGEIYEPLKASALLTAAQRAEVKLLLEDCVGQCVLPYFKLYRLTGNTAGQIFTDLVRTGKAFPELSVRDLVHEHHYGEKRVLSGADLVHEVVEGTYGISNLLANGFHTDGFWHEGSLSYQSMVLHGLMPCLEELEGYSDPPDCRLADPDWTRLENFQPSQWPFLRRVLTSLPLLALPDGGILPLGDSHKKTKIVPDWFEKIAGLVDAGPPSVSAWSSFHDGIGVAALRCGTGPDATAAFLTYGPRGGGHSHFDQLSLTFYSLGHELATDIGYPGSTDPFRHTWWNRAAAHNTVVVDGRNQAQSIGRLDAFAESSRFELVQARCANAYPHLQDYRRTLILVGDDASPDGVRYLIDVFHVVGGTCHDFAFHAQSEPEMPPAVFVSSGVELAGVPDASMTLLDLTAQAEPKTMGYDCISQLSRGAASATWSAEWRIGDEHDTRLRLCRLVEGKEQVFVGQAPGHRVYPGHAKVDVGKQMTWVCSRREGKAPLRSAFVSVVSAQRGANAAVRSVRLLDVSASEDAGSVAVEVVHAHGSDVVIVSRFPSDVLLPEKNLRSDGLAAAVAYNLAGAAVHAMIVGGTGLNGDGFQVPAGPGNVTGSITALPEGVCGGPLVIQVDREIPALLGVRVLTMEHANGTGSAWLVHGVDAADDGASRLLLDRAGREGVGRVGKVSDDGLTVFTNSGFHRLDPGMNELFYGGCWVVVGEQWRQIRSVTMHPRKDPYLWEVVLQTPLAADRDWTGLPFTVSRVAVGDRFRIPATEFWRP